MRAVGSDRKKLAANPHQQHCFLTDMTKQLGSVCKCVLRNAEGKIGTMRIGTGRHSFSFDGAGRVGRYVFVTSNSILAGIDHRLMCLPSAANCFR